MLVPTGARSIARYRLAGPHAQASLLNRSSRSRRYVAVWSDQARTIARQDVHKPLLDRMGGETARFSLTKGILLSFRAVVRDHPESSRINTLHCTSSRFGSNFDGAGA